jgi:hypothetical protein
VNEDSAHGDRAGSINGSPQRIEQEASPQSDLLLGAIDCEAGDQASGDREVLGSRAPDAARRFSVLDLRGDEGVIADDLGLALSAGDEGPGGVTALALTGIGAQPSVELLTTAVESIDVVARF